MESEPRTMVQRLEAVEAQYQQMQQRLERLEKRLGALDARVGGREVEILQPPPAERNQRR